MTGPKIKITAYPAKRPHTKALFVFDGFIPQKIVNEIMEIGTVFGGDADTYRNTEFIGRQFRSLYTGWSDVKVTLYHQSLREMLTLIHRLDMSMWGPVETVWEKEAGLDLVPQSVAMFVHNAPATAVKLCLNTYQDSAEFCGACGEFTEGVVTEIYLVDDDDETVGEPVMVQGDGTYIKESIQQARKFAKLAGEELAIEVYEFPQEVF